MKTYRSIFVSDVHLGTKDCQADRLNNFLKHNSCDTLYLVGDIIDAWKIQQNKWRWKQSHTNVVRRILGHAKRGTRVVYVSAVLLDYTALLLLPSKRPRATQI